MEQSVELARLGAISPNTEDIIINTERFVIGRGKNCNKEIVTPEISRRHVIFRKKQDGTWTVTDHSSNGILINHKTVKKHEEITIAFNTTISLTTTLKYIFKEKNELKRKEPEEDCIEKKKTKLEIASKNKKAASKKDSQSSSKGAGAASSSKSDTLVLDEKTENELMCSICLEFFVEPMTLNCSHTFCNYCLALWRKKNTCCPICRKKITNLNPTRALEAIIANIIEKSNDNLKADRRKLISDRAKEMKNVIITINDSSSDSDYSVDTVDSYDSLDEADSGGYDSEAMSYDYDFHFGYQY